MPLSLPKHQEIKDNYLCLYLGHSSEYVIILRLLREQIEKQLPGTKIWLSCDPSLFHLLGEEPRTVSSDKIDRSNFAYIREIRNEFDNHSLQRLLDESSLKVVPINSAIVKKKGICLICPEGIEPVKSLDRYKLEAAKREIKNRGYGSIVIGSDVHFSIPEIKNRPSGKDKFTILDDAGWVFGVENEFLVTAASRGIKTTLVRTGVGHALFKRMFPLMEML